MMTAFVRRYTGLHYLPECVMERLSGRKPGLMVWDVISCHTRSSLLRMEANLSSNRYVREVLQPEVVHFFQGIPGAIFQQDYVHPYCKLKSLKKWLNLKTISGVWNESLIFLSIFKTIFSSYILRWEKLLKCCYFRDKKHFKSFHLKRLKSSLRSFNF